MKLQAVKQSFLRSMKPNNDWEILSKNMRIIFKDTFIHKLENQLDFIAKNNPANARKFKDELYYLSAHPLADFSENRQTALT